MAYQVALADSAKADANQIHDWVCERAPVRGPEWFGELIECLYSLEELPYRCPLAREARAARRDIRCLLFGKRRNTYRILYEIDEPRQPCGYFTSATALSTILRRMCLAILRAEAYTIRVRL